MNEQIRERIERIAEHHSHEMFGDTKVQPGCHRAIIDAITAFAEEAHKEEQSNKWKVPQLVEILIEVQAVLAEMGNEDTADLERRITKLIG